MHLSGLKYRVFDEIKVQCVVLRQDWKLVNSISATERVALWDRFSGPVDQHAIKLDFIRRATTARPAFRSVASLPLQPSPSLYSFLCDPLTFEPTTNYTRNDYYYYSPEYGRCFPLVPRRVR